MRAWLASERSNTRACPDIRTCPTVLFVLTVASHLILCACLSVEHPPARPAPSVSRMRQQRPLSTDAAAGVAAIFPLHARFPHECAPLMKKWNGACPASTIAPTCLPLHAACNCRAYTVHGCSWAPHAYWCSRANFACHARVDRYTRRDRIYMRPIPTPVNVATW
jgi:hypothetical protein